jgi:hypothetical protein
MVEVGVATGVEDLTGTRDSAEAGVSGDSGESEDLTGTRDSGNSGYSRYSKDSSGISDSTGVARTKSLSFFPQEDNAIDNINSTAIVFLNTNSNVKLHQYPPPAFG